MTKHNLTDTTFIIPVKIESDDRLRNAITVCCFLLSKFDTNILIKEVNSEPVFENEALPQIKEFIGDIRDKTILERVFASFRPDVVFHAAAYKHVPMQELHPWSAVSTNVLGTLHLVQLSKQFNTEKFVGGNGGSSVENFSSHCLNNSSFFGDTFE